MSWRILFVCSVISHQICIARTLPIVNNITRLPIDAHNALRPTLTGAFVDNAVIFG